ncbi:MAG TPA: hypothetical protein VNP20_08905 [Nocardioidaceae bacterium]|nr:hypothetical protein [Nocardioidaceae bacterium]
MSEPAERALTAAGYTRLEQLAEVREEDIARLHGVGPTVLTRLRTALRDHGMQFRSRP